MKIFKEKEKITENQQIKIILENFAESLNYKIVNNCLKKLVENKRKEYIYLTGNKENILEILDLKNENFTEDEFQTSQFHISKWITESKRFDTKKFFENLKKNSKKIEIGIISDISKIHKSEEKKEEFYWEHKSLGPWVKKYTENIMYKNFPNKISDQTIVENILGEIPKNIMEKACHFIDCRFNHYLKFKKEDIEKELKNWYISL